MRKLRNLQVKAGIVYQDDHIRLPRRNIGLAVPYIPGDGSALEKHFPKAHYGRVPVISYQPLPFLMRLINAVHELAAPEADIGRRILRVQALHEVAAVKVSGGLAGDDVIFHNLSSLPGMEQR